ncbi:MgtC/SapB family protein [Isachenkonia alkalipeptolytica]|uniref:MgtC/SapB family protein n=1 Tax=Isachenkonia alkalipeptolytica TaxID=2565777 RepID=A0AA43XN76_9CLOT|nr:MgtC/SapB family protein [Isachenkonia alkalipeptolytica]NBG89596.1 MgtC/SapB family protein [Isachenkonia alkalipeptolytica]
MIGTMEIALRLFLAAVLGGIIGFEREVSNRPAGFRTHILVTLGSCLIMILSAYGFHGLGPDGSGGEPARLAAQVVSGIGFLGAGTILREGTNVRGLTTAASIWISGGIGLAIGLGYYAAASLTTLLALFSLMGLKALEGKIYKLKRYSEVRFNAFGRPGLVGEIGTIFGKYHISIKNIIVDQKSYTDEEYEKDLEITFFLRTPRNFKRSSCFNDLKNIQGIEKIVWDDEEIFHSNLKEGS